jgi:uncharacterized membrane protein
MKKIFKHIWKYLFRGLIAAIPFFLSIVAFRLFYVFIDHRVNDLMDKLFGWRIPGVGILVAMAFFYLLGLFASHIIGRRLFGILETVLDRIPIINTTYQIGKQISDMISLTETEMFSRVVLLEGFREHALTVGFVTGTLKNEHGKELLKIFVPTVPNPTTGFIMIVEPGKVIDPGWTIEEGLKMVISGGIIGPSSINKK